MKRNNSLSEAWIQDQHARMNEAFEHFGIDRSRMHTLKEVKRAITPDDLSAAENQLEKPALIWVPPTSLMSFPQQIEAINNHPVTGKSGDVRISDRRYIYDGRTFSTWAKQQKSEEMWRVGIVAGGKDITLPKEIYDLIHYKTDSRYEQPEIARVGGSMRCWSHLLSRQGLSSMDGTAPYMSLSMQKLVAGEELDTVSGTVLNARNDATQTQFETNPKRFGLQDESTVRHADWREGDRLSLHSSYGEDRSDRLRVRGVRWIDMT